MTIEQRLEKLEKVVSRLSTDKRKTWVRASEITRLTGWNNEGMRKARDNGYVKFKKVNNSFWYLLESLNPVFIKSAI